MTRKEFNRKQRIEIFARAKGCCELCGMKLKAGEGEYDHIIAQGYNGNNETDNGQLLCVPCHKAKTGKDKATTEKCKRIKDKHEGTFWKAKNPMPGSKASRFKKRMDGKVVER